MILASVPLRLVTLLALLPALAAAQPRKLLVISIDGLDARFLRDADKLRLKIPNLRKLMATGAVASGVVGLAPTVTWPMHTTLITGVPPSKHGIASNDQPGKPGQRWWSVNYLKAPTLWQQTMQHHLKTAAVYWPVTLGAQVDFNCPEFWETRSEREITFDPIARQCTPGLVEKIGRAHPDFVRSLWTDSTTLTAVSYLLAHEQPDLTLAHIADLDAEEHETGALSIYSRDTLENDDELIGNVLRNVPPHTLVAIVSDHGFETERRVVRPRVMLKQAKLNAEVFVSDGLIGTADPKAAAFFRKAIANKKSGIAREVPMKEVRELAPPLGNWTAAFDTLPGYIPSEDSKGAAVGFGNHKGVHGLWPTHDDYRSSFVLSGESVRHGTLGEISILQIAPTFADILGVELPEAKKPSLWPKINLAGDATPAKKPVAPTRKRRKPRTSTTAPPS